MKFGFIGSGNMAAAIIKGAVLSGSFEKGSIMAYDVDLNKPKALSNSFGISAESDVNAMIEKSDAVVLAVKPNVFSTLLPSVSEALSKKNPLIISIAAGKTIEFISSLLTFDAAIIRIMPNINAAVGEAMSAYCFNSAVTDEQKSFAEKLCGSFGRVMCLPESSFPLFGVIAGCAPAYAYMFIDSLARAGVKNGMSKKEALLISAQTVLGSAKTVLESGEHPWELIDSVCSPGGTTVEGVSSLLSDGFESAVMNSVDAALDKDKKL